MKKTLIILSLMAFAFCYGSQIHQQIIDSELIKIAARNLTGNPGNPKPPRQTWLSYFPQLINEYIKTKPQGAVEKKEGE